jgi:ketosteroid isomerase-like protein
MKRAVAVAVLAVLAVGLAPAWGDDKANSDLQALDAKMTEAFRNRDAKMLDKHTADDYMLITPTGQIRSKKGIMERLEKGNVKLSEMKEPDVKARVIGDTGVVTGMLHLKGTAEGKDFGGDYRWARVYTKKGGEWQCLVEQHTYVFPPEKKP